ncbi:MAG: hypothetical protein ABJH96_14135 [Algoriphagus sp.]|uniref:hypothetical protein n=1 Tax=Algoriphagus sp. TaxID=1872435 RepID=UPI0032985CFD
MNTLSFVQKTYAQEKMMFSEIYFLDIRINLLKNYFELIYLVIGEMSHFIG